MSARLASAGLRDANGQHENETGEVGLDELRRSAIFLTFGWRSYGEKLLPAFKREPTVTLQTSPWTFSLASRMMEVAGYIMSSE